MTSLTILRIDSRPEEARADLWVALERERGRRSFRKFVGMAWHVVEPARTFVPGWHIDAICEHLQAITEGKIRDLIINMPPRHMKSLLVGVLWPAWEWIDHPENAFLTASYADTLAVRDAVKARRLITSAWYRERWGAAFRLAGDQNAKTRYDNDRGGYRIATSVNGVATGEGGDRIVVDDPINVKEASSATVRLAANTWWDESMSTRGNDPKKVARVIVMQRTHEQDLTGHCLQRAETNYVHLKLPAEYRGHKGRTVIGFEDPRKNPGDLLWPERFGKPEVDKLKVDLGTYAASAQLQQEPIPAGGGTFKLEWFPRYGVLPANGIRTVSIDCANKAKELNSYSVAGSFLEVGQNAYVAKVWRDRVEYPALKRNVINFCADVKPHQVLIEDKGNGTALIQDLQTSTRIPVIPIEPDGDKLMRAQRTSPTVEARRVLLPDFAPWLPDFEYEIGHFPATDFFDQVDMLTQFLDRFARGPIPGFASAGTRTMQGLQR